jgi:hypothetical protein
MVAAEEKRRAELAQRQTQRIQPFVAPCRYVFGGRRLPGFLTDLSERGGRIHTDTEPPAPGTVLTVEARLGRKALYVGIPATVRWARPAPRGGFVSGVSFDGIGPDEQKVLDTVVDEFRRRAASIE